MVVNCETRALKTCCKRRKIASLLLALITMADPTTAKKPDAKSTAGKILAEETKMNDEKPSSAKIKAAFVPALGNVGYPVFALCADADNQLFCAGGGGNSRSGVVNAIVHAAIFAYLKFGGKVFSMCDFPRRPASGGTPRRKSSRWRGSTKWRRTRAP